MFKFKKNLSRTERLLNDRTSQVLLVIGILLNIASWIYIFINIKPQTDPIFLHYNIYFGVDLIGDWYRIYRIPLVGVAVYFINLYFSSILYRRERTISYFVIGITIFLQAIVLVSSYLITQQNI